MPGKFLYFCDMRLKVRLILLLLMLCAGVCMARTPIEAFASSAAVDEANTAVMIIDLNDGRVMAELNSGLPLIPASVTKAVTIGALLRKSGIDYRYDTKVYAEGPIKEGVLKGNLVIVGSGDPSLGASCDPRSTDFIEECIVGLRKKGIRTIEGTIEVDCSVFAEPACHPSWAAADTRAYYGTGCRGFNFEQNRFGKSANQNPVGTFIGKLKSRLASEGIELKDESCEGKRGTMIAEHKSPPIDEIMRSCMMRSDNLYAEALLRTLALVEDKCGSTEEGARLSARMWKKDGIDCTDVNLVDGSGLSRTNRMTAKFLAGVLKKMSGNVDYVSFFPLAGAEGTLRNFLKDTPLDSYIAMKTGSMNGIQSYAGYKLDEEYAPTHIVVIMTNKFPGSRAAFRSACSDLLLRTFFPDTYPMSDEQNRTDTTSESDL